MIATDQFFVTDDSDVVWRFSMLLMKLRVAALQEHKISLASTLAGRGPISIPKYAIRLPVVSTAFEYMVLVRYNAEGAVKL